MVRGAVTAGGLTTTADRLLCCGAAAAACALACERPALLVPAPHGSAPLLLLLLSSPCHRALLRAPCCCAAAASACCACCAARRSRSLRASPPACPPATPLPACSTATPSCCTTPSCRGCPAAGTCRHAGQPAQQADPRPDGRQAHAFCVCTWVAPHLAGLELGELGEGQKKKNNAYCIASLLTMLCRTLPAMNLASLERDRGGRLVLDMNSRLSTTWRSRWGGRGRRLWECSSRKWQG